MNVSFYRPMNVLHFQLYLELVKVPLYLKDMDIFDIIFRLAHPKNRPGYAEATAYFTGDVRRATAGVRAHFKPRDYNEYMVRFFTDDGEKTAWCAFYPLEDPAPESVKGQSIRIRYQKSRPWNIERIPGTDHN